MSTGFVYMAYAADDRAEVGVLSDLLRERGWSVCFGRLVEPGVDDGDSNLQRIADAFRVVVVWSSNAANSALVRADAVEAGRHGKLLVVALDDVAPPVRGASVIKLQTWTGATDTAAFEAVLNELGPANPPRWRRRGVVIPYMGYPHSQVVRWGGGAALVSAALAVFLTLGIRGSAPTPAPTHEAPGPSAGLAEGEPSPAAPPPGAAARAEWNDLAQQDLNAIRGFIRERGGTTAGESAGNLAARLEEFAWRDIFKASDLPARLGGLSEFRIDFPDGPHAGEAQKLDIHYRDLMRRIRADLVSLGFISPASKADIETLRAGARAYERSIGLGTSGMITENLAGLLSISVDNRSPVR